MSWRIYFEATATFGIVNFIFLGRYNLCPKFIKIVIPNLLELFNVREEFYEILDEVVDRNLNIGFMDVYCSGSLGLLPQFCPLHDSDHDHVFKWAKYEDKRLNIGKQIQWTNFYLGVEYLTLHWRVRGLKTFIYPRFWNRMFRFGLNFIKGGIASMIHKIQNMGRPPNSIIAARGEEFKTYKYNPKINDW